MSDALMSGSGSMRRNFLRLIAFALLAGVGTSAVAAQAEEDESRVKAAFLLRFSQYVEWPAQVFQQPRTPLVIGVVGAEGVASELQQMSSERGASGRPVQVRTLKGIDEVTQAHVLFIGLEDKGRVAPYVSAARGRPILVVTEAPDALAQGSMINFVVVDRRIRFEIGLESAEKVGLILSSRLLSVAMRVHKGEAPAGTILAFPSLR